MNAPTVQLSTIPTAPAAEAPTPAAPPDTPSGAASPAPKESGGASGADTKDDPALEMSRRLEGISRKEARTRAREAELHEARVAVDSKQKEIDAKLAELDAALSDPVQYMLDKGKDPVEVARRFATPETAEEKRIRKLEEDAASRKAADEKAAADHEQRSAEMARNAYVRDFVGSINPEEHPNVVALYEPTEIPTLVTKLLQRPINPDDPRSPSVLKAFIAEHGRKPTDAEIREQLEVDAESRATRILKANAAKAAAPPASQSPEQTTEQAPSPPPRVRSGISNQHAATTTSGKKRPLSLEEKRRQTRNELVGALEAERDDEA